MNFLGKTATALTLAASLFASAANAGDLFAPDNGAGNRSGQGAECGRVYLDRDGKNLLGGMLGTAPEKWSDEIRIGIRAKTSCERDALKNAVNREIERAANDAKRALSLVEAIAAGRENAKKPLEHTVKDLDLREIMNKYADFLRGETQEPNKKQVEAAIGDWAGRKKEEINTAIEKIVGPQSGTPKPAYVGPRLTT